MQAAGLVLVLVVVIVVMVVVVEVGSTLASPSIRLSKLPLERRHSTWLIHF